MTPPASALHPSKPWRHLELHAALLNPHGTCRLKTPNPSTVSEASSSAVEGVLASSQGGQHECDYSA
eukprot:363879-Chlamydomonas_euryale.AAC.3